MPTGIDVERALLGSVTTVHVACGGHAGDDGSMAATVAAALEHAVRVGAHPSYPDRAGFGRQPDGDRPRRARRVAERAAAGARPRLPRRPARRSSRSRRTGRSTKRWPRAARSTRPSATPCATASARTPPWCCRRAVAPWRWSLRDGVVACEEGFCDRAYRPDGGLVDRATPGAVLSDPEEAAAQALASPAARWWPTTARVLTLWVDTLCIHGDSPGAVAIATAVRRAHGRTRGSTWSRRRVHDPVRPRRGGAAPR